LTEKIIIGAGRQAAETYYLLEDIGISNDLIAFANDNPLPGQQLNGKKIIAINDLLLQYKNIATKPAVLIAIGTIDIHKRFAAQFRDAGFPFFNALNKDFVIERHKIIGEGVTIADGTIFTCNVSIGNHVIINIGCTISHDCVIGDHVNISPGCNLAGNVIIEDDVFVGTGAIFMPNVRVGRGSIIAAGACITKDIPSFTMAAGVPAIIKKKLL
jgi:acetyltransferase EpsM